MKICVSGLLIVMLLAGHLSCRRRSLPLSPASQSNTEISRGGFYPVKPNSFVNLLKQVGPAIVHLKTNASVKNGPFDWFPKDNFYANTQEWMPLEKNNPLRNALGTGFVVHSDGTVVTNAHIVANQDPIYGVWQDGRQHTLEIIGKDEQGDIAILRPITASLEKFIPVRLGNSDQCEVGEWLLALANPFGYGLTVNTGLLSGSNHQEIPPGRKGYWGFLQTDINFHAGNSGGPVLNMFGEVIAVSMATMPPISGLGFAIPINFVIRVMPHLKKDGRIVRAWIGIYVEKLPLEMAKKVGLNTQEGALITSVVEGGPGNKAGLKTGDVILKFDGAPISKPEALPWRTAFLGVNKQILVEIWRNGTVITMNLQTEAMPE